MTRDEAVDYIKMQLGFRTDQTANIISNLKLAQITLEGEPTLPWFMMSDLTTLTTVADTATLSIPGGFLREEEDVKLTYFPEPDAENPTPVQLRKDDYDLLARLYAAEDTGPPVAFALLKDQFHFFPTPDDAYTIKLYYLIEQTTLDTNVENNWLRYTPLLVMGMAGKYMSSALRDDRAAAVFSDWENRGRLMLNNRNESRMHAARSYQIGGPH